MIHANTTELDTERVTIAKVKTMRIGNTGTNESIETAQTTESVNGINYLRPISVSLSA